MSERDDFLLTCHVVAASAAAGVSVEAMRRPGRSKKLSHCRMAFMARAHHSGFTNGAIGEAFNRDRSTVYHAAKWWRGR